LGGQGERESAGLRGRGPKAVVTDLGILEPNQNGELTLVRLHPQITVNQVKENTGWDLKIAEDLQETLPPTENELNILREELDPNRIYLK
jgi:glutaconate CoA-transferase subunit B